MVPSVEQEGKSGKESQGTMASLMEACLLVFYSLKHLCIHTSPTERCARGVSKLQLQGAGNITYLVSIELNA